MKVESRKHSHYTTPSQYVKAPANIQHDETWITWSIFTNNTDKSPNDILISKITDY